MKTSGSKRERVVSYDYSDTRNAKSKSSIEDLPAHESMSKNFQFYNGKINTDLLKRFLRTRINQDWDTVYSEIIERIPAKLQDYKYCVYWYVADKVEIRNDQIWNLKDHAFIPTNNEELHSHWARNYRYMEFYVDPETNKLIRIDDFESRRATKILNRDELRRFRENEQREKLDNKRSKTRTEDEVIKLKEILRKRKIEKDQ